VPAPGRHGYAQLVRTSNVTAATGQTHRSAGGGEAESCEETIIEREEVVDRDDLIAGDAENLECARTEDAIRAADAGVGADGMTRRSYASFSLDLDNDWSYRKTRGDPSWSAYPSYFALVVPRAREILERRGMRITWFLVGKDAECVENHAPLRAIAERGHEIGNHSYHHEPWLHLYEPRQLEAEIASAEEAIVTATGVRPVGFRGPGFSVTPAVVEVLIRRGYHYDASTLPTFIGPLARAFAKEAARATLRLLPLIGADAADPLAPATADQGGRPCQASGRGAALGREDGHAEHARPRPASRPDRRRPCPWDASCPYRGLLASVSA